MSATSFAELDAAGLNLQAVFDLAQIPDSIVVRLRQIAGDLAPYRQLVLIGNAGSALWRAVDAARLKTDDPIDEFSARAVADWFTRHHGEAARMQLYPGAAAVDLQALGALAGWHHPSPFRVGINDRFGTWFAYRVAMLANSRIPPTRPWTSASPCTGCATRPCIAACPAKALSPETFSLDACIEYRRTDGSRCAATCVARLQCPVGLPHRYDEAQIRHGYAHSLRMIEAYATGKGSR